MNTINPSISVYRHGIKPKYLLLRHARTTTYGDFTHLSAEEMMNEGKDIIFADFKEFPTRDPNHGSIVNGFTLEAKKARKFLRNYDKVHVTLDSQASSLRFGPVCVTGRSRDSGVVRKQDVRLLSLPCTNQAFFQELQVAFDKCCYTENV